MAERSRSDPRGASSHRTASRPTRGADRNRDAIADGADPPEGEALLPALDDGITLLDVEGGRGVPVLQSLVLDHLLLHDGPAFWVDADGHATTATLARLAPSRRLLDRIHVARGFTPYQHFAALRDLPDAVNRAVRNGSASPAPALVVCPALDARYREDDTLGDAHARTLQARALASLGSYARGYDVPVLVTRTADDAFAAPIETAADRRLRCERTRAGPRIVGDDFETLVYPVDDGAFYQTTFAYWRRLLGVRAERAGVQPASPPVPPTAGDGVGRAVATDGTSAPASPSPLLDAWTSGGGVGGR